MLIKIIIIIGLVFVIVDCFLMKSASMRSRAEERVLAEMKNEVKEGIK